MAVAGRIQPPGLEFEPCALNQTDHSMFYAETLDEKVVTFRDNCSYGGSHDSAFILVVFLCLSASKFAY